MHITLVEESYAQIARRDLTEQEALEIARSYDRFFHLTFPNPHHPEHYILRAKGYAGSFPLRRDKCIRVVPKVPCSCVWSMLAYTQNASSLHWFQGEIVCESIEQIFEFLAVELVRRIEARCHRGLRWNYEVKEGSGSPIRGRILGPDYRNSWGLNFRYSEGGADCLDNQILLWTLYSMRPMAWSKYLMQDIDRLYLYLRSEISLVPESAHLGGRRSYRRQQTDYHAMHVLCRFLLHHIGPGMREGTLPALPLALHMPSLFEECISLWLIRSFAAKWQIKKQWELGLEGSDNLSFRIDLALFDGEGKIPLAIIDAKYKLDRQPASEDIQQVVAYAVRLGVATAILIYPREDIDAVALRVGGVAVYSIGLDISKADWSHTGKILNRQIDHILTYN